MSNIINISWKAVRSAIAEEKARKEREAEIAARAAKDEKDAELINTAVSRVLLVLMEVGVLPATFVNPFEVEVEAKKGGDGDKNELR